ncbi:MAG: MtnX-like HAD-IB family phosphatase [Candidatus Gastranaerophilales bacterium]|nr:MtnX-like HAD-IB family phosphatase [Candidatus Gastranaerophilales bacterium]
MNDIVIFCDFDGTITTEDTIDKLLEVYADKKWLEIEELWEAGKIGSKECLEKQLNCINRFSEELLSEFIETIEIDNNFIDFINNVKAQNIDFYIISDGFELFIEKILEKNGIKDIKIFSNQIALKEGKLIASFPYYRQNCEAQAGMCKCNTIKNIKLERKIIYIGDGRSDMCASKHADILYAKKKLADFCSNKNIDFIKFENFNEVQQSLAQEVNFNVEAGYAIR